MSGDVQALLREDIARPNGQGSVYVADPVIRRRLAEHLAGLGWVRRSRADMVAEGKERMEARGAVLTALMSSGVEDAGRVRAVVMQAVYAAVRAATSALESAPLGAHRGPYTALLEQAHAVAEHLAGAAQHYSAGAFDGEAAVAVHQEIVRALSRATADASDLALVLYGLSDEDAVWLVEAARHHTPGGRGHVADAVREALRSRRHPL